MHLHGVGDERLTLLAAMEPPPVIRTPRAAVAYYYDSA